MGPHRVDMSLLSSVPDAAGQSWDLGCCPIMSSSRRFQDSVQSGQQGDDTLWVPSPGTAIISDCKEQ